MRSLSETARFLDGLNVVDISFDETDTQFEVYLALTPTERAQGLANLAAEHLDVDGMLFHFPNPSYVPFTAADMLFDLNMAWYDNQGSIIKQARATAGSRQPLCSPQPFTWVLESTSSIPTGSLRFHRGA